MYFADLEIEQREVAGLKIIFSVCGKVELSHVERRRKGNDEVANAVISTPTLFLLVYDIAHLRPAHHPVGLTL